MGKNPKPRAKTRSQKALEGLNAHLRLFQGHDDPKTAAALEWAAAEIARLTSIDPAAVRKSINKGTPGSLTFNELRFASRMHATKVALMGELMLTSLFNKRGKPPPGGLAKALAEIVIQCDRIAANNRIDLAAAIKAWYEPESDSGGQLSAKENPRHGMERQRPSEGV